MHERMVWDSMINEVKNIIKRLEIEILTQVEDNPNNFIDDSKQLGFLTGLSEAISIIKSMTTHDLMEGY
jgi:hypothetical protein